jgi:hypothetical protein
MRKSILVLIVVILTVQGFAHQVFSMGDRPPMKKKGSVQKTSELLRVTGNVTAIKTDKSLIMISTREGMALDIIIDQKTTLSKGGRSIKLSDVRKGDFAKGIYETIQGKNIAKAINFEAGNIIPSGRQTKKRY